MEDKPAASPGRYNMISCDRVEMNCVLEVANILVLYHFVILLSTYFYMMNHDVTPIDIMIYNLYAVERCRYGSCQICRLRETSTMIGGQKDLAAWPVCVFSGEGFRRSPSVWLCLFNNHQRQFAEDSSSLQRFAIHSCKSQVHDVHAREPMAGSNGTLVRVVSSSGCSGLSFKMFEVVLCFGPNGSTDPIWFRMLLNSSRKVRIQKLHSISLVWMWCLLW